MIKKNFYIVEPALVKPYTEDAEHFINQLLPRLNLIVSQEDKQNYIETLSLIKDHNYGKY